MSKWGIIAGLLLGVGIYATIEKIVECHEKGGTLVYSTCIKKDAIL